MEKHNGRIVVKKLDFESTETFGAYHKAGSWLYDNGFSCGSMDYPRPIAILEGDVNIAKWHNLTKDEIKMIDGVMIGEYRQGPVSILLYK